MNDINSQPFPDSVKVEVREKVKYNILRHHKAQHKIERRTEKYRKIVENLRKNKNIHIVKADKGNSTVILNKAEYENKMNDHLTEGPYKMLPNNPTELYRKHVLKYCESLSKEDKITKIEQKCLTSHNSRTPILYGAPKIHKENVPLRPIVSSYNSPTQKLSKLLHGILKPIVGKNGLSVQNSADFVKKLEKIQLKPGEILISYDAKSLFTSIPINRLLQFTHDALQKDGKLKLRTKLSTNDIVSGMEICLRNTYFNYRGTFYEQEDGMAMGCPLSTIGADIFMERMENELIVNNQAIKFYSRYVDDIFMIIRARQAKNILRLLNSFDKNVQFTYELQEKNKLPFLDVLIHRQDDGSMKFSIYRKSTHTDKYLDWHSVHPKAHKITVVNTLVQRALKICDPTFLDDEIKYITDALVYMNNYPRKWVETHIKQIKINFYKQLPKIPEEQPRVILPYIPNLTENVARVINRKLGNPLGYIPYNRMSDIVSSHKDKEICPKCGIYVVICTCGSMYIGETGRDLNVRLKEHKDSTRLGHLDKSAIANHAWENINDEKHKIQWEDAKIIVSEGRYTQRKMMEAVLIKKAMKDRTPIMNRKEEEGRTWIPSFWDSLFFEIFKNKL